MKNGDVMGYETMGEIVGIGAGVRNLKIGGCVVTPFTISYGDCFFCMKGLLPGCGRGNPSPNRRLAETI
jgi:threonine dehydrogenase-like Zn-dependent dehydrogenase